MDTSPDSIINEKSDSQGYLMKEYELIARQAKQLEELRDEVTDLRERMKRAWMYLYSIGGPLNDNYLRYNRQQMEIFFRIAKELE